MLDKLTGPIFRFFRKQLSLDLKISVPDTVEGNNVPVDVWYLANPKILPPAARTPEFIKAQPGTIHVDADRENPAEQTGVTMPLDGYLYIVAEPKGEWKDVYTIPEVKEERIRTGKEYKFILALARAKPDDPSKSDGPVPPKRNKFSL
jgi:hypothetical protein